MHAVAAHGFAAAADTYEVARPSYPDEAVDFVVAALHLPPDPTVLDLAAGTGKFTRLLVARGIRCIAVEPVHEMRRILAEQLPEVWSFNGTAEDIPLENESVSGVVVAQAFHWFDPEEALAEIHRVAAPGARLALVWNVRDTRVDWVRQVTDIIDAHDHDNVRVPRYRDAAVRWRPVLDRSELFTAETEGAFDYGQEMDVDTLCARMASVSFIATLDVAAREEVLEQLRQLARTHPDLAGKERFAHPYVTEVYVYRKV